MESDLIKNIQKKHYDLIAKNYTKKIHEKSYNYYFEFTRDIIVHILKNSLKRLDKCKGLDIGCGNGDFTTAIKDVCLCMVGTDISNGMVSLAKKSHKSKRLNFIASSSDNLRFKESEFDFSIAAHLFHHLIDKKLVKNTILEMKRVVKDKGLIIIVDVNKINPFSVLIQYLMTQRGVDTGKERLVWPQTITKLFKKYKIKIIKYNGFCLIPHIFPKLKKYNKLLEKTFLNKFLGKDYIIVGRVLK
jgi:ubiquinone/menaquinone biosynthesis C-methylase UbiE